MKREGAIRIDSEAILHDLFKQYNRRLLFFARAIIENQKVAEEIVSDSFVKLWENRGSFSSSDKIKAFLYIVTKNACINYLRSSHRQQVFDYEFDEQLISSDPDAYTKIVKAELMQQIHEEIMRLPDKQREVFLLTYIEGLSTDEIGQRLGMAASAIFANRSRATQALRQVFKGKELWIALPILKAWWDNVM